MTKPDMYYQESGAMSTKGIIYTIGAGIFGAVVFGAVYGYASWYIPLIYFNLILCGLFGVGLGWLVGKASYLGEVRNQSFLMITAVVILNAEPLNSIPPPTIPWANVSAS